MRLPICFLATCSLVACSETSSSDDTPTAERTQYALGGAFVTITYNPDTDVYLVTPVDDEAQRHEGVPVFDRLGFDRANGPGILAVQMRGDSQVALYADLRELPADVIINFDRSADSTMPTGGDAIYTGDYYAYVFVNNDFAGEIIGDATLTASFDGDPTISGTITNRQTFPLLSPMVPVDTPSDLVLELAPLTGDGRVALDGATTPEVSGAASDMFGSTFEVLDGRYGGMVAGPDGAHFIGGVEVFYIDSLLDEAVEYGAIAASQ